MIVSSTSKIYNIIVLYRSADTYIHIEDIMNQLSKSIGGICTSRINKVVLGLA